MKKLNIHEEYLKTYGSDAHLTLASLDLDTGLAIDAKYQAMADNGELDPDMPKSTAEDFCQGTGIYSLGPDTLYPLADALEDMHKEIREAVVKAFTARLPRPALDGILAAMSLTCDMSRLEICHGISLCGSQLESAWAKAHPDQEACNDQE